MENVNPKSKPTKTPTLRPPRPSSNNAPELDSPNLLEKAHCSVAKLKKYCVQFELPVPSYSTVKLSAYVYCLIFIKTLPI